MRASTGRWWKRGGAVLACVTAAACGGGGGGGGPPPSNASLSGQLVFNAGPGASAVVLEAEPNDSVDQAHHLGSLTAGQTLVVRGHTTVSGDDPFDGFRLLAPQRVRITATLAFPAGGGNDFDMGVFELTSLQWAEVFLATTSPEVGTFHAKGLFDLVIEAFAGSGDYVLTLLAEAPATPIAERSPNDVFADGQYLGDATVGDVITVAGSASSASDPADIVYVTCPAACRLAGSLAMPGGADFDFSVHDGTLDHDAPTEAAVFDSPSNNPETGTVTVPAGKLVGVRVEAFSGAGAWILTLGVQSPAPKPGVPFESGAGAVAAKRLEAGRRKPGAGTLAYGRVTREIVPGEALVGLQRGVDATALVEAPWRAAKPAAEALEDFVHMRLDVPEDLPPEERVRATWARVAGLASLPGVRYAEPNGVCRAMAEPDDDFYNLQWHYPLLHLPEAWNVTTGSSSVIVAVLDTGRTDHPDLAANQVGGYDFISDATRAGDGNGRDANPTDVGDRPAEGGSSSFHGTHVAGTIGATTDNGSGVAGVCWHVQLMHVRVLGRGGGTNADIADGIRYAARLPNAAGVLPPTRAHVINMSLGGPGFSQTMQDAVSAARAAGVIVFAAAGNESSSDFFQPAGLADVVAVSAVDVRRQLAPYSNFGPSVDLACPGGDTSVDRTGDGYADGVLSTLYDDSVSPAEAVYVFYQGTSMACPHAAGVAALMLAVDPTLTPSEIESIMRSTAEDLGPPGRDDSYGSGLVNALRCVQAAQGAPPGAPVLALSPTAVSLGTSLTTADVLVTNAGGGLLTLGALSVSTDSGGAWLSAVPFGGGDATRSATGVRVGVSRTGLPVGSYAGRVQVASDGGTAQVQVLMSVAGGSPAMPDVDLYVLAVDAATGTTVAQDVVNPTTGLAFSIDGLPAGTYLLYAGSDLDDDGFICDEGEYCGEWPVEGDAMTLALGQGEGISGLAFGVTQPADLAAVQGTAPARSVPRARAGGRLKSLGCR